MVRIFFFGLYLLLVVSIRVNAGFVPEFELAGEASYGSTYTDPVTGMEFVWVKGDCYQMGSNDGDFDEKPVHEVCVDDFWMGKYEVTQGQYKVMTKRFLWSGGNPSHFKKGDTYPVEQVSWNDVQDYITNLNKKSGKHYRLPTEAEWEYAARSGGKNEKYAGGNNVDAVAWYRSNSGDKTHPVGQKLANGLGLHDMSGNVWEWCQDWYDGSYYSNGPRNNPQGPSIGSSRVSRGGWWLDSPRFLRSANRYNNSPEFSDYNLGFRLVLP